MTKKILIITMLLLLSGVVIAQKKTVSGTVLDEKQQPLIGATVLEKGTTNGTAVDAEGKFTLNVSENAILQVRFVGFKTQELSVSGRSTFNIVMAGDAALDDVVVVGSRGVPRVEVDTPLPIDKIGAKELVATGQTTFDKALQYSIPSFSTVQTPVNDATSLLDPYEIRNMGPSRTLILINGKRKNLSSLLYVQTSPGRGETGADISAIPIDAIKRVEVLRDGASAQYGSDAIAGVINVVLKDQTDAPALTLRGGVTGAGDGEFFGVSFTNGSKFAGKGFINYAVDLSQQGLSNRPGTVNAAGEAMDFGADINFVNEFLTRKPDAGNINGAPQTTASKFLINGGINISENTEVYGNAAYVYKKVNSFANYRTPYWRTIQDFPYLANFFPGNHPTNPSGYDGYVPSFDGNLADYHATLGVKGKLGEWNHDASLTVGGNQQSYTVNNSHNRNFVYSPSTWLDANSNGTVDTGELTQGSLLYRENSPITFDVGGTRFTHTVGNIDVSRKIGEKLSLGLGTEFRSETFTVIEGSLASYDGGGADSFAGNQPENSGKFNRYNIGGYIDLLYDITDNFLINGTARVEEYSDFGEAFVWKVSSRYKFLDDKVIVRGSASTGFRAPTLHQIYTQKAQYSFVPGQGIQVGGLVNNVSPQAKLLGIKPLEAEKSQNFTAGLALKPKKGVSIAIDYYNIEVRDRIILGTEIGPTTAGNTPLDALLTANNLSDVSFFSNAIDTRTSGIDFVGSIRYLALGSGTLSINLSGNVVLENKRINNVKNPAIVESSNQSVANATQEALFFTSRPETKWILGLNYELGKVTFMVNNTLFGKTTFKQQGLDNNLRTEFEPRVVTDLGVTISPTDKLTISLNANNILGILPQWKFVAENPAGQAIIDDTSTNAFGLTPIQVQSNLITFNQRYSQMTYDGYHFSQLGFLFNASVQLRF
ncbi:TonB-dependent receptor [uncultured Microscilla sp.]|uniref:TonB-dependent receptor n=1 Tax=uncultured Microscilla sp. TaxID=432653 RepID=UPI002605C090|nr:TonB-dependent receptor [uncultured Microscilla sp.]